MISRKKSLQRASLAMLGFCCILTLGLFIFLHPLWVQVVFVCSIAPTMLIAGILLLGAWIAPNEPRPILPGLKVPTAADEKRSFRISGLLLLLGMMLYWQFIQITANPHPDALKILLVFPISTGFVLAFALIFASFVMS